MGTDVRRRSSNSVAGLLNRAALVFAVGVLLVAVAAAVAVLIIRDAHADVADRLDPLELLHAELLQEMTDAETASRGYALTRDEQFLEPLRLSRIEHPRLVAELLRLSASDPALSTQVRLETDAAQRWLDDYLDPTLAAIDAGITADQYVAERLRGKLLFDDLRSEHAATQLLIDVRQDEARDRVGRATAVGFLVTFGTVAAVLVAGLLLARRARSALLDPLDELVSGIARLQAGDLSARAPERGPTEVRAVAAATNQFARLLEHSAALDDARAVSDQLVSDVAAKMREHIETPQLLAATVDVLGPASGCDRVLVLGADDGRRPGAILAEWVQHGTDAFGIGTQLAFPDSFVGTVVAHVATGATWALDDASAHDTHDALAADSVSFLEQHGVRSLLVAPIRVAGRARAVLALLCSGQRTWSEIEHWMARALATELGSAMRLGDQFHAERSMVRELQRIDAAKSDFISSVSHELRTPLTSILGYTELLLDGDVGELTARQHSMTSVVDRNARRLLLLIDDLLTMSRIESDRLVITPAATRVADLVDGVAETIRPLAAAAGLTLQADAGIAGLTVWADARALERALLNVTSNAVKFTPPDGTVTITAQDVDDGVQITVADTGVGIPEDEQAQLFTRFYRSTTSRELAIPGTGLGLAIVRHIVEAHHGTVALKSRPGEGTSVTLWLPGGPGPEE